MSNHKLIKIVVCLLTLSILTMGSFSNVVAVSEQPRYGGTFIIAMGADAENLNPAITTSTYPDQIGSLIFNDLLKYDENFKPYPDLAQSWQVAPDGLTYTFRLVRNASFHDGHPLTSADVKFTFTQVLAKYHSAMLNAMSYVASVDTPDDYTVVFKMSKPYTPFLFLLRAGSMGGILPAHLYSGTDILTNKYNFAPVGSGPFKFVEWKRGEYVKLTRNDKYFKAGQPYLDQIIFKVTPDPSQRVIALQKGDINYLWWYTVSPSAVPQLIKDPNLVYTYEHQFTAPDVIQVFLNLRNSILNNTDVRHALAYAVNRTELVNKVVFGQGKVATGPFPSAYGQAVWNPNLPVYSYDVAKANDLLDKAGYKRGSDGTRFSTELTWPVENEALGRAAELLKSQFGRVGVTLKLAPRDRATMIDTVFNRWQYDMFLMTMGTGPVPDVGVARLSLTSNILHNPFDNAAAYSNPTVDALWADAANTVDPAKRTQDLHRLQEIIVQDSPHLWLWEQKTIGIWTKDFAGLHTAATNAGAYDMWEAYWTKGSLVSPQSALKAITDAQSKLTDLEKQGYEVTAAKSLLGQAQSAYNSGNYASVQSLTSDALRAAVAPFPWALVAGVVTVAVVAAIIGVFMLRKRRQTEQEAKPEKT